MAGVFIFLAGFLLLGAGAALYFVEAPPPLDQDIWKWSALGAGGVLALIGILLKLTQRKPAGPKKHSVDIDSPMLLHAIFEVAAADDDLGEAETLMIELVSQHILGKRMGSREIAASFIEYRRNGAAGVFDDTRSKPSPEAAYAALKAATLVALSDGDLQASERGRLSAIAKRFGMTEERLSSCIADARAAYESVVAQAETQAGTQAGAQGA